MRTAEQCWSATRCALAVITLCAAPAVAAPDLALSADAHTMVQWVVNSGDNERAPFIVIDKRQARLWVFDANARQLAQTPVLLGLARGDRSVPGIALREMADIRRHERTTPAGRFFAEPGRNADGEDIFWIDYDAAVSMHRVRTSNKSDRRLERLASPSIDDNRISYGCINVPAAFYDTHIRPLFSSRRGVVYLLPEAQALDTLFTGAKASRATPRIEARAQ